MKYTKFIRTNVLSVVLIGVTSFAVAEPSVEITDISINDNIYTPLYQAQTKLDNQQAASKKWLQIHLEFTTSDEWLDEVTVLFSALVNEGEEKTPIVLTDEVTFINVKPGEHYANVYVHPNLRERYEVSGFDIDAAAAVMVDGKTAASVETTKHADKGWSDIDNPIIHKGHLLNHSETPFWFINYDFKEVIKQGDHARLNKLEK
ncbi:hypothetical protein P4C99_03775 [Pontiellaceae bacterium B1224]|nr:hypothetical protein [Pontiellaceae bacterium B1224]